jgi:hypothetical protein
LRAISILEDVRHHPYFRDLVKFVVDNDKYGLRYTESGLKRYVKMLNETSGIQGLITNQYGQVTKGLSNFKTVKLIREL